VGRVAAAAQIQQQFSWFAAQNGTIQWPEMSMISFRTTQLQSVRSNLAGGTPTHEDHYSPSDLLKVRTIGPAVPTVSPPNVFVVNEELEAVHVGPDSGQAPRHEWRAAAQPIYQNRKTFGLLPRHSLTGPTLEMLAQHEMRGEIESGPPLAQGRCVRAKLRQEIAQLAPLAHVYRLDHYLRDYS